MAEQRVVTIQMDATQQTAMREATDYAEWNKAIGYLSTWNMSFPNVAIYPDGPTDLVAVYSSESNPREYVIGAVWHDDHYGFHS